MDSIYKVFDILLLIANKTNKTKQNKTNKQQQQPKKKKKNEYTRLGIRLRNYAVLIFSIRKGREIGSHPSILYEISCRPKPFLVVHKIEDLTRVVISYEFHKFHMK